MPQDAMKDRLAVALGRLEYLKVVYALADAKGRANLVAMLERLHDHEALESLKALRTQTWAL